MAATRMCTNHGQVTLMACSSCKIFVCLKCMDTEKHDGHKIRTIDYVAENMKSDLEISNNRPCFVQLEKVITDLTDVRLAEKDSAEKTRTALLKRRDQIKQSLDMKTNIAIEKLNSHNDKLFRDLDEVKTNATEQFKKVTKYQNEGNRILAVDNPYEVIEQGWRMILPEIVKQDFPSVSRLAFIEDVAGTSNDVEKLLGELVEQDVYAPSSVNCDETDYNSVIYNQDELSSVRTIDLYWDGPQEDAPKETVKDEFHNTGTQPKTAQTCRNLKCDVNLSYQRSFEMPKETYVMRPTQAGNYWVVCENEKTKIKLVGRNGDILRVVSCGTRVVDLIVLPETQRVLALCYLKCCVKRVESNESKHHGNPSTMLRTTPLRPISMCSTPSGDILITLTDKKIYSVEPNSTSVLARYNSKGKELARAHKDERGKDLFFLPGKVCVSNTGTVAAINCYAVSRHYLVMLDHDLKLLLRYVDQGVTVAADKMVPASLPECFYITDVLFTHNNLILMSEHYSRTVQLLDSLCNPLKILANENQSHPWFLTLLASGDLWVGLRNGTVKVYKYTCEFTQEEN